MSQASWEPARPDSEEYFRARLLKAARDYVLFTGSAQVHVSEEVAGGVTVDLLLTLADSPLKLAGSLDGG